MGALSAPKSLSLTLAVPLMESAQVNRPVSSKMVMPPYQGDGYTTCYKPRLPDPEPECRSDEDCPRDHACIGAICQNPCELNNPCTRSQRCVVENSLPIRTVACVCPNGFVQGTGGDCVKVTATPECYRNEDCRTSEVCHTGSCLDACLVYDCAPDAICSSTVHDIECTCRPGFTGDGRS